jgi:hypothetical protein
MTKQTSRQYSFGHQGGLVVHQTRRNQQKSYMVPFLKTMKIG